MSAAWNAYVRSDISPSVVSEFSFAAIICAADMASPVGCASGSGSGSGCACGFSSGWCC